MADGKEDRYNFDGGADDDLGASSTETSTGDREQDSRSSDSGRDVGGGSSQSVQVEESRTRRTQTSEADSTADDIPHRVRHDSPKEGRQSKTVYFDQDDISLMREFQSLAEEEFDGTVYQLDVYLAAFRSDLTEESFLEEMRAIGYGYFDE